MTETEFPVRARPSARARLGVALAIGLASAVACGFFLQQPNARPDFPFWWSAARILLSGGNPYAAEPGTAEWPYPDPFFYPLPALLPIVPIAWLPMPVAGGLFLGTAGGLLTWLVTREDWYRLWLFASAPYLMALKVGQCSPLVLCAAFVPALGWLAAVKPQLGIAVLLWRPTWTAFAMAASVSALSIAVMPGWIGDWRTNLAHLEFHPAPAMTLAGVFLWLGAVRWRSREGRVFLALACVPQLLFFADQLPLWLVPRTRRECAVLTLCSLIGFVAWWTLLEHGDYYVVLAAPWVLGTVFAPALGLLLRHAWLERRKVRVRQGSAEQP